jgi:hypothetical protein
MNPWFVVKRNHIKGTDTDEKFVYLEDKLVGSTIDYGDRTEHWDLDGDFIANKSDDEIEEILEALVSLMVAFG